jgi:hypothetical protein
MDWGFGLRDPEKKLSRIPDPGAKKAPVPKSGPATLVKISGKIFFSFTESGHGDQIGGERAVRPVPARLAALLLLPAGGRGELRAHAQPLRQLRG